MTERSSIAAWRALLGMLAVMLALFLAFLRLVHGVWVRNESASSVQMVCGPFVNVTLHADEDRHLAYSIFGRSYSCVLRSSTGEAVCSRPLRGLEDVHIAVFSDDRVECDDY
jgi:hypothetical protein